LPFDLATHTLRGEPFRVVNYGIGPTVSSDGTIAYGQDLAGLQQLTWVDRNGTVGTPIGEPQAAIIGLKLSPDGTRVAVGGQEGQEVGRTNIWVHDVARGTKVKVTSGNSDCCPVWHPREPRLAFMHLDDWSIRSVNADAGEDAAIMAGGDHGASFVPNWPPDGRFLLFSRFSPDTQDDIWMLPAGATTPVPVIRGPAKESGGSLSPDGRYITYWSDESGAYEILVREFPSGQGRQQVSVGGGTSSYWSPKGDEIFYVHEQQLMSARVRTGPALQIDAPRPLFRLERTTGGFDPSFDTLDGRRFVVVRTLKPAQSTVVVVQNWFEEFRRK
jgi:Tol biopolymer transport system component